MKQQQPKAPTPKASKRRLVRRFSGRMRLTAIALFVVTIVGAVMMLAASQPVENTATPEPLKLVAATAPESAPAPQPTRKASTRKATPAVVTAKATTSAATATGPVPAVAAAPAHAPAPANAAAAKAPANGVKGEVVTITGCLELDNQEYRLTETAGADAPKKRSWKSGFLKKRASDLEVLDTAKTLRLATHLGQRVTVTGIVEDSKMEAWSLVVASRSCN